MLRIHRIPLSEEKQKSLLAFHALTGCDTTSQFYGVGKATAWKCSRRFHSCSQTLVEKVLSAHALMLVFRRSRKDLDALLPTQHALMLHISRAHYQTMVWKKALEPCPSFPRPEDSGWSYNEGVLKPILMIQEVVSVACLQLTFCPCSREHRVAASIGVASVTDFLLFGPGLQMQ